MKNNLSKCKKLLSGLEAPVTFSIMLVFIQGLLEIFEVNKFLFLDRNELVFILSYLILFIYFFPIYLKLNKNNKKIKAKSKNISTIINCFILGSLFAIIFNISLQYILGILLKQDITSTTEGMRVSYIYLFIVCIIGPCMEELCYRGMVFKRLENDFSERVIVIFSSLVFGFSHFSSLGNVIYALILGYVMMSIFIKKKSLIYSILFHIGANVSSTLIGAFPSPSISNMIIYLPVLFIAIGIVFYILKKEKYLVL